MRSRLPSGRIFERSRRSLRLRLSCSRGARGRGDAFGLELGHEGRPSPRRSAGRESCSCRRRPSDSTSCRHRGEADAYGGAARVEKLPAGLVSRRARGSMLEHQRSRRPPPAGIADATEGRWGAYRFLHQDLRPQWVGGVRDRQSCGIPRRCTMMMVGVGGVGFLHDLRRESRTA